MRLQFKLNLKRSFECGRTTSDFTSFDFVNSTIYGSDIKVSLRDLQTIIRMCASLLANCLSGNISQGSHFSCLPQRFQLFPCSYAFYLLGVHCCVSFKSNEVVKKLHRDLKLLMYK